MFRVKNFHNVVSEVNFQNSLEASSRFATTNSQTTYLNQSYSHTNLAKYSETYLLQQL